MAEKKTEKSGKGEKRSSGDTARRIWLAGIGAYGRAFTEAQEALKDVTGSTSKVFDDLVQKGEMIETVVSTKSKEMMGKAGVPSFDFDLDERIQKMRSRLKRGEDVAEDISALETRMNAMDAKLDKILSLLEPKKPALKTAKKPARKPAKKPAKKTTTTTKRTSRKT